jgi:hypothetical protein
MKRVAALLALLMMGSACSRGLSLEQDGDGGLFSTKGNSWSYYQGGGVPVGATWSAGGVFLCRTAPDVVAHIVSIGPASVDGQVKVDRIGVRTALRPPRTGARDLDPGPYILGAMHGSPDGVRDPRGYLVPNTCPGEPDSEVGEIVMTLTKTGPEGGGIDGLLVTYEWDGHEHQYMVPVGFGLCGTDTKSQCS